ncbi:hypothetical protein Nepgr_025911 [Nepenthes gracilis]|uniref:Uncharacterized protein n=1 Tax=Nepenthes gracilis TaxID=150966 RepID=A0AAD3T752_NEPGR|nr:hypothetical protein Nepgr_025911 [Nepenthes gracilis]
MLMSKWAEWEIEAQRGPNRENLVNLMDSFWVFGWLSSERFCSPFNRIFSSLSLWVLSCFSHPQVHESITLQLLQ